MKISDISSNWTHKLMYSDLTPEMQDQVDQRHKTSKNKPEIGDKYFYHFKIIEPPANYIGHMPYGIYSHRSVNPFHQHKADATYHKYDVRFK